MQQTPYATQQPWNWTHVNTAGTVEVKAQPAVLAGMNVNDPVAATTFTLYDVANTGTLTNEIGVIAVATSTPLGFISVGPMGAGIRTTNGLAVVSSSSADVTLIWR